MEKFYVYCHKNPQTREIFYIGKGTGNRAYVKYSRGRSWNNYVNKHGLPIVEFLHLNLTDEDALKIESSLIMELGRKDLKNGPLVNTTNGGEGCSGLRHTDESKKKISKSHLGKPSHRKGVKMSDEFKDRMSKRAIGVKRGKYKTRIDKGKTFSDEIKKKFKEAKRKQSKKVLQYDKKNNLIKEWDCAYDVIDELKLKGIYNNLTGISKTCGGFIWKYKL